MMKKKKVHKYQHGLSYFYDDDDVNQGLSK